jgi:hypothetical protein
MPLGTAVMTQQPRLSQAEHPAPPFTSIFGSPFQHVVERRQSFRRRLLDLAERDHQLLREMTAIGGTDQP